MKTDELSTAVVPLHFPEFPDFAFAARPLGFSPASRCVHVDFYVHVGLPVLALTSVFF